MEARGFEKIHGAERVHFKIENGNVTSFVVGGLGSAVNDQIETVRTKKRFERNAIANVHVVVSEVFRAAP